MAKRGPDWQKALTRKWKGLPAWAWGVGAGIALYLVYRVVGGGSAAGSTTTAQPAVLPLYVGGAAAATQSRAQRRRTLVVIAGGQSSTRTPVAISAPGIAGPSTTGTTATSRATTAPPVTQTPTNATMRGPSVVVNGPPDTTNGATYLSRVTAPNQLTVQKVQAGHVVAQYHQTLGTLFTLLHSTVGGLKIPGLSTQTVIADQHLADQYYYAHSQAALASLHARGFTGT